MTTALCCFICAMSTGWSFAFRVGHRREYVSHFLSVLFPERDKPLKILLVIGHKYLTLGPAYVLHWVTLFSAFFLPSKGFKSPVCRVSSYQQTTINITQGTFILGEWYHREAHFPLFSDFPSMALQVDRGTVAEMKAPFVDACNFLATFRNTLFASPPATKLLNHIL